MVISDPWWRGFRTCRSSVGFRRVFAFQSCHQTALWFPWSLWLDIARNLLEFDKLLAGITPHVSRSREECHGAEGGRALIRQRVSFAAFRAERAKIDSQE